MQPLYVVAELAATLTTGVGYSLADDTISDLGAACASPGSTGCSSSPQVLNTAFVLFGVLQAVGAVAMLRSARPHAPSRTVVTVALLWLVAGVATVGVGLVPVDQHPTAHGLVAAPVFVCQPLALVLHARLLRRGGLWAVGTLLGTAALVGAATFALTLGADHGVGAWERLATWPAKLWLALAAVGYLAGEEPSGPRAAA